jgi:glycosyltransferase involved in cell wall biosynthesis
MNRFVFIIPFRNARNFIFECANSLIKQKFNNWRAIFCDDQSNDGTIEMIPKDIRFEIRRNRERMTALPNIHLGIIDSNLDDDDIICILDGDDFLIRTDALDILDNIYSDDQTLLTYGQYIWPNRQIGHCIPYTKDTFSKLRTGGYWASHLRTFKYKLYKELINQDPDLSCYKDKQGNFYTITYDVAIMTPLMEIAGLDSIKFNPEPIYYYRVHQMNDHFVDSKLQKEVADEIFSKPKFKQVF